MFRNFGGHFNLQSNVWTLLSERRHLLSYVIVKKINYYAGYFIQSIFIMYNNMLLIIDYIMGVWKGDVNTHITKRGY